MRARQGRNAARPERTERSRKGDGHHDEQVGEQAGRFRAGAGDGELGRVREQTGHHGRSCGAEAARLVRGLGPIWRGVAP